MNNVNVEEYKKFITLGKEHGNIKKLPNNTKPFIEDFLYGRRAGAGNKRVKSRKMNKARKPKTKKVTKQRKTYKKNKSKPKSKL